MSSLNELSSADDGFANTLLLRADPSLPHRSRILGLQERKHADLYTFYSPKNRRIVSVIGAINFAVTLSVEFDPDVIAYVERPCQLHLTTTKSIDITLWMRRKSGEERFVLSVPTGATRAGPGSSKIPLEKERLDAAVKRQGLAVDLIFERELATNGIRLSNYFRLLPYVQSSRRLNTFGVIQDALLALIETEKQASLGDLARSLPAFPSCDVMAVIATCVHVGRLYLADEGPISLRSLVGRGKTP